MKEYFGESAKVYGLTRGKRLLLLPALRRHLPKAPNKSARLLDVACGNGDSYPIAKSRKYQYFGIDISPELLERAQAAFPEGTYAAGDARKIAGRYKKPFDAIIVSMLFPAMGNLKDILKVLEGCRESLKKGGVLLVAVTHPSFDHYMQSFLFERGDVKTDFQGYFRSGQKFEMQQFIDDQPFLFEDFHWTMSDYLNTFSKAGFSVAAIDECKATPITDEDIKWAENRDRFPTYLVFSLKK